MRWLLLEEFVEIKKGISSTSRARFPNFELGPETLLIEMMAQTGGVLLGAEKDFKEDVIFAKIESAQFLAYGKPGEWIEITAVAEDLRPEAGWIQGVVRNSQTVLAKAKIMLASVGALVPGKAQSVTFHPGFMDYFKIREKVK